MLVELLGAEAHPSIGFTPFSILVIKLVFSDLALATNQRPIFDENSNRIDCFLQCRIASIHRLTG